MLSLTELTLLKNPESPQKYQDTPKGMSSIVLFFNNATYNEFNYFKCIYIGNIFFTETMPCRLVFI